MDDWVRGAINYQVNLRSLAAREPRNAIEAANEQELASSPLAYLARNISVLAELGITVLHIMPPFPMGKSVRKGIGSPYSVRNYRGVDPEYGSLDDLRSCIGATHRNRLKFLLDMVPNHTSRDHGWIEHNPEYYVRGSSGALVYDADWTDTAKLDYTNPALRQDMIENFDFWLSMLGEDEDGIVQGVDGFRIDMAHLINDRTFWNEALQELRARHPGRELLFMAESYGRDNNLDLLGRGFNAAYDDDFYKVCRNLYGVDASGQTALIESTRAGDQEEFALSHQAHQARGIAGAFERILEECEEKVGSRPDSPRLVRYTDNHVEGRGVQSVWRRRRPRRQSTDLSRGAHHSLSTDRPGIRRREPAVHSHPARHLRQEQASSTRRYCKGIPGDRIRGQSVCPWAAPAARVVRVLQGFDYTAVEEYRTHTGKFSPS